MFMKQYSGLIPLDIKRRDNYQKDEDATKKFAAMNPQIEYILAKNKCVWRWEF